ncbi:kunitz-type serine protease inhibitor bitisilin-3-like [Lacerta agilis]|uniref:kunitz-type serine protease inhibitor bitisilin-3-like n=1 Tax=Lacerta agilis TaxID=80427 RepID=UPI001419309D|nr:kunitz-type serine protease inhibitor bitisilin-3-like [Lacerta agilis]
MQGSHTAVLILELLICWFEPLAACQQKSGGYPSKCKIPTETGKCKGSFPRFYFDIRTRKCEEFVYSGCGGNANNFMNPVNCIWECERFVYMPRRCKLPVVSGPCRSYNRRFFYNTKTNRCELFIYGGCKGNANNFTERIDCIRQCQSYGKTKRQLTAPTFILVLSIRLLFPAMQYFVLI